MVLRGVLFGCFVAAATFFNQHSLTAGFPVDLTVLFAGLVVAGVVFGVLTHQMPSTLPETWKWLLPLYGLFLLAAMWAPASPYSSDKITQMLTGVLITVAVPFVWFRSDESLRPLFWTLSILGLVLGVDALLQLSGSSAPASRSTEALGVGTIYLSRAVAVPFIWAFVLAKAGQMRRVVYVPVLLVTGLTLLVSGSRGPVISLVVTIGVLSVFYYRAKLKSLAQITAVIVGVILVATHFASSLLPVASWDRISALLGGSVGENEIRARLWHLASSNIASHPLGIGWGGFDGLDRYAPAHPHNLFLETFLEGGWLFGAFLVVLFCVGLKRSSQLARTGSPERIASHGFLIFFLTSAMFSGNIAGHRNLWLGIALALAAAVNQPAGQAEPPEPLGLARPHPALQ